MPFQGGVWNGEAMTPMQRAGAALMMVGNGPFAGMGQAVLEMNKHRLDQQRVDQSLGALMGKINGVPTLEGQKAPAEIRRLEAQAKQAEMNADKDYLFEIEKKKLEHAKELQLAVERAKVEQGLEFLKKLRFSRDGAQQGPQSTPNPRYIWEPQTEQPAPASVPPSPTRQSPASPLNDAAQPPLRLDPRRDPRTGYLPAPVKGSTAAPWDNESQASFGEYYRGPDGNVYRKADLRTKDGPFVYGGR